MEDAFSFRERDGGEQEKMVGIRLRPTNWQSLVNKAPADTDKQQVHAQTQIVDKSMTWAGLTFAIEVFRSRCVPSNGVVVPG